MSRMSLRLLCIAFVAGFFAVIGTAPADAVAASCARADPGTRLCHPANATPRRTTGDFVGILGRHLGNDFRFPRRAPRAGSASLCDISAVRRSRAHLRRLVHRGAAQGPAHCRRWGPGPDGDWATCQWCLGVRPDPTARPARPALAGKSAGTRAQLERGLTARPNPGFRKQRPAA